jgi:DNA polymerase-1
VAATGRLSCQDPNLQNIPVRTETGLRIREAFKPEKENWSYVAADYSQIELRLLAHLSEDPILLSAFENGEDIHRHTASVVFHVPLEEVTKDMRSRAKAVNFGIIYGQGAYGLSQVIKVSQKEASQFIAHYFEQYPQVKLFLESCKDSARLTGKTVTITGRERLVPEILSKNIQIRNAAERLAVNTPFQGSAADLIKLAMLSINEELKNSSHQGYMILQVHDELIFEVPDDEVPYFKNLIKNKMETVIDLKVPLIVDVEVGKNWKEC